MNLQHSYLFVVFLLHAFRRGLAQVDFFYNLLGNVELCPYVSSGTTVSSASDLNCDFSSPCCWHNAAPPVDDLEWNLGNIIPNKGKFRKAFCVDERPHVPYLVVSSRATTPSTYGILTSCSLPCQTGTGTLRLRKWLSPEVTLDVCVLPEGSDAYSFCKTLNGATDSYVEIPEQNGPFQPAGAAIIDDITYSATIEPCPSLPIIAAPEVPISPPDFCADIKCSFVGSLCRYTGNAGICMFQSVNGRMGPWAGGVPSGPGGGSYAGTGLGPGGRSVLQSPSFTNSLPAQIGFQYYEGPLGNTFKACLDGDINCPFVKVSQSLASDRQWSKGSIDVPPGTHMINFVAYNEGGELSGVGIADIKLLTYGGQPMNC